MATKTLKIQIGVCKRMIKEVASYEKEVITNEARIQKMKDEGKDPYDIRKQEEVLQESYMMVPNSKGRLQESITKLQELVVELDVSALSEAEKSIVQEANTLIEENRGEMTA